jgi:phosphatidate cytidylyltransferase
MNSFTTRLLSGIVYIALLIGAIWFNNFYTFILFGFFIIVGTKELYKLLKVDESLSYTGIALNLAVYILMSRLWFHAYILFVLLLVTFLFLQVLFKKRIENPFEQIGSTVLSLFYITIPMTLALRLPFVTDQGFRPEILLGVFILIWSSDTFAYLVGTKFGRTKLFERISPNKTWEGSVGGAVCTVAIGFVLQQFWPLEHRLTWPLIAVICAVLGTLGDLVESVLKRKAGVKDSGNIMPGHGGILDRLDSFIFAIPVVYMVLSIL